MLDGAGPEPIIRMFHVYKRYGSQTALHDISLDIGKNEFVFITGLSGAGKTTLLRLLFLDEVVSGGQILVNGINLQRIPLTKIPFLRRDIGVVFQDFRLINTYSVYENIALVLETAGRPKSYIQKKVRQVLRLVGLEDRIHALPPRLSGGEQQRVALARAAVGDPSILLADEPTGNLDEKCAHMVFDLLKQLHTRGTTIIVATHDQRVLEMVRARIVLLNKGRIEGHIAV